MTMPGPIKPSEVQELKNANIPEEVFTAFNELIVKNWSAASGTAVISQDEVVDAILASMGEKITRQEIFDRKWLDIESAYGDEGWVVDYDKPGYNENYEATFTFLKGT